MSNPKIVKVFCFERRYYNSAIRFSEVERIFLLGEDMRSVTAEDIVRGLSFHFVPLENLVVPATGGGDAW